MKRACARCGKLVPSSERHCPKHKAEAERKKRARDVEQGRHSPHWRRLRQLALARDGWRCVKCGSRSQLEVHLDEKLEGDHNRAGLDDCATLCRPCHVETFGR